MAPTTIERLHHFDRDWRMRRRLAVRRRAAALVGFGLFLGLAVYVSRFDPGSLIAGLPKISDFLSGLVPPLRIASLWRDLANWFWAPGKWLWLLWVTCMIALIGTVIGTLLGGFMSFFAARNLGARPATVFAVRRVLEVARTVPDLVWALVFLFAFGLGPLAGALAIIVHTIGAQGKLFAEVNENAEPGALEGVRASGGTWIDEIATGLLPQVLPNYVSYTLWRFETNMRSATIIGFVGAGGIGMELYEALSLNYFDDAGAILLIVFVAVAIIDIIGERLRLRISDTPLHQAA